MFSCTSPEEELVQQTLEDFLYDVANKTPERFHMASKEQLEALGITENTWSENGLAAAIITMDKQQIEDNWKLILEKLNEKMAETDGIDWSNYTVGSCHFNKAHVLDEIDGVESFGALGNVDLKSNGKDITITFMITIANGKALYIDEINDFVLNFDMDWLKVIPAGQDDE